MFLLEKKKLSEIGLKPIKHRSVVMLKIKITKTKIYEIANKKE